MGLYVIYLLDWLSVFSREQILILRLEDHAANRKITMRRVFEFLQLGEFRSFHASTYIKYDNVGLFV